MMISEDLFIKIAICALGVAGYLVARHIHHEKRESRPLVCPINFDCDTVVHSDYSKILGMPIEIFGMLYYAFISLSYLASILLATVWPHTLPNALVGFMAISSMGAFLFSMYLIGVQLFILKKWCSWCLVSAFICILIFSFTALAYDFTHLAEFI
ncbi:MAG: vitamin K epoxide reductase family protein [bacterium]|nr:vitamin K epoxide reductase family protein [bacterium]